MARSRRYGQYDCGCHLIEISGIEVVAGTSLTFTVPDRSFTAGEIYTLKICLALPTELTGLEEVIISSNDVDYPLQRGNGDVLRSGYLRGNERIRLCYGADPVHFMSMDKLHCMKYRPDGGSVEIEGASLVVPKAGTTSNYSTQIPEVETSYVNTPITTEIAPVKKGSAVRTVLE